jgi:oxygen-independent coproporphyrinogen III oxidase
MAGIYIHIPFCVQKCSYCNFYSIANLTLKGDFLKALALEIVQHKADFENETVETVYFGGGTPSLLSAGEIDAILTLLSVHYHWSNDMEITLEANPDDLTLEYLTKLAQTKVNRLSIGIQSFNDDILKQINRRHSSEQAIQCIENAQKAGFSNLSIDLIYGIPNHQDAQWLENLSLAAKFQVPHLSCYALTVEEHTVLHKKIEMNRADAPNEEDAVRQFDLLMDFAAKEGYHQYEISNYCRDNLYSRHNRAYWNGVPYLGFGPGAHSYRQNIRRWNITNVAEYIKGINHGTSISEEEWLTLRDQFNEYLMTALRTDVGVDLELVKTRFGTRYADWTKSQLDKIDSELFSIHQNRINLTQKGKHWADYVTRELFMEES